MPSFARRCARSPPYASLADHPLQITPHTAHPDRKSHAVQTRKPPSFQRDGNIILPSQPEVNQGVQLAVWRYDYNNVTPHSSLGNRTPAARISNWQTLVMTAGPEAGRSGAGQDPCPFLESRSRPHRNASRKNRRRPKRRNPITAKGSPHRGDDLEPLRGTPPATPLPDQYLRSRPSLSLRTSLTRSCRRPAGGLNRSVTIAAAIRRISIPGRS